jgi:hypothetical protein
MRLSLESMTDQECNQTNDQEKPQRETTGRNIMFIVDRSVKHRVVVFVVVVLVAYTTIVTCFQGMGVVVILVHGILTRGYTFSRHDDQSVKGAGEFKEDAIYEHAEKKTNDK